MSLESPRAWRRRDVLLSALAVGVTAPAQAVDYPSRPIRVIVPFPAGGSTDVLARSIGQKLQEQWGQPLVTENKPGASGWLGITEVGRAPPDGYTLGLTISNIVYAHALYPKLPFDIRRDFEPVSMLSRSAVALAVASSFPANRLAEFVEQVRRNPGRHSYASFGQGTSAHIYGELLNIEARLDMAHVPYKGSAPLVTDLLGGHVSLGILDTASLRPLAEAGKVKLLAISGTQRSAVFPDVPTFAELGYRGFEPLGFFMVLAPAGTPRDLVNKLSEGIGRAVRSEDIHTKMLDLGQEPVGSTPEQLAQAIHHDGEAFARAIRLARIEVE